MQRAVNTEECNLEELEGKVEDHRAASGSVKLGEEAKFQRLEQRIHFLKEIAGQLNRKLDMKRCELVEKKQLLAVEEKLKLGEEETQKYKRRLEECQRQMQEAEIAWRHQIAFAEKKAQDNWVRICFLPSLCAQLATTEHRCVFLLQLRAQALERENAEMRREVAYLKQRLEAISRQRQAEEYMRQEAILGGPYGLHPPLTSLVDVGAFVCHPTHLSLLFCGSIRMQVGPQEQPQPPVSLPGKMKAYSSVPLLSLCRRRGGVTPGLCSARENLTEDIVTFL
ncbi:transport and Golgi organization protein 1 homolog isoform X2 [Camelus bactrianus]